MALMLFWSVRYANVVSIDQQMSKYYRMIDCAECDKKELEEWCVIDDNTLCWDCMYKAALKREWDKWK